jgi:hypothetical protein
MAQWTFLTQDATWLCNYTEEAARIFQAFILEWATGANPPPLLRPMELLWDAGVREADQDIGSYLPYWNRLDGG